jgi:hypothetical protein
MHCYGQIKGHGNKMTLSTISKSFANLQEAAFETA